MDDGRKRVMDILAMRNQTPVSALPRLGMLGSALPPMTANPNMLAQHQRRSGMNALDPSMYRSDGSKKGLGFLGALPSFDGRTSTELSIGVGFDGKEQEIPLLVPTLNPQELLYILQGGTPTDPMVDKAVAHARMRTGKGLPVFANKNDYGK